LLASEVPCFAERFANLEVYLETIEEGTAGGNCGVLESRFVEDYAAAIRRRIAQGLRPELILIPSAFGGPWGMDVFGDSYARLETEFGVPVRLIDWLFVYGREV
jgi:hypothetical protein